MVSVDTMTMHRAKTCMDVIKTALKEDKHASLNTIITNLNEAEPASVWKPVLLSASWYCMDTVKTKLKEHGYHLKDVASVLGEPIEQVKEWFNNGTLPYAAFMECCRLCDKTKVIDVYTQANEAIKQAREHGNEIHKVPIPVIPSKAIMSDWFDGSVPFVWFLFLTKLAGLKAGIVFDKAKEILKQEQANQPAPVPETRKPWKDTYIKDTQADNIELPDTPTSTVTQDTSLTVQHNASEDTEPESTPSTISVSNTAQSESQVSHDDSADSTSQRKFDSIDDELDAWEDTDNLDDPDTGGTQDTGNTPVEDTHAPVLVDNTDDTLVPVDDASWDVDDTEGAPDAITLPSNAEPEVLFPLDGATKNANTSSETETGNDDEPVFQREVAPGVTEADLTAVREEPYEFSYAGRESGMSYASEVIMNWNPLREEALKNHDGMTPERLKKLMESYPKAVKLSDTLVGLVFSGGEAAQSSFIEKGYMRELQDVINRKGIRATLQQANFDLPKE